MKNPADSGLYDIPSHNRTRRTWLWAAVAALAVRLVVVGFTYQGFLDPGRDHWEFGYEMGKIARSLATGHGFGNPYSGVNTGPTAIIGPVYPGLLAGVMALFGIYTKAAALAMLTVNSVFSALTCVPIFFLAKRSFGVREARWATWTWAFFPYAVYYSTGSMWDHALNALLLTWLLLIALHLENSTRLWEWAGFGLLGGLGALTNAVVLGTLPFLGGWACYRLHRQNRNWRIPAATAGFAVLITLAPWLIRNYRTFHRPVFLKDGFPLEVLVGNFGNAPHWWNGSVLPYDNPAEMAKFLRLGEPAYMAEKWQQAFAFIRSNAETVLWRSLRRLVYVWTGYWSFRREYLREEPLDPPNIIFCTAFTFLALAGLSRAFRGTPDRAMPYAFVLLLYPMVYYVTHPDLAYRHPLDPQIVILGSYAVVSWLRARESSRSQPLLHQAEPEPSLASRNGMSR